jgi:hypothetical protein
MPSSLTPVTTPDYLGTTSNPRITGLLTFTLRGTSESITNAMKLTMLLSLISLPFVQWCQQRCLGANTGRNKTSW